MKSTGKTVFSVALIMIATKIMTMVGNLLYMASFGLTAEIEVYSYALNVPNTIFNCIGTALNTVVIPIYLTLAAKKDQEGAKRFLDDIISISCVLILVLIAAGFLIAPVLVSATGFRSDPALSSYAVFALRLLMPVMLFYGLNYIFQGILQANGSFKLPALVSAPSSLVIILYVIFLGGRYGVTGLLVATLAGLSLQPIIMIPAIRKLGYRYRFSFGIKSEAMKSAARAIPPVLVSVSSYQINMLVNLTLATRFGTITIMTYVLNITLVSILSVVYAIASVYFPKLTAHWAQGDKKGYQSSLAQVLMTLAFLLIPASAGFVVLKGEIADFIANWGNIGAENVRIAATMLGLYGGGICAIGLKEILDKAFYSQRDTKTPAIFGFVIMASNIILSLSLMRIFGTYAMPLSYSIASFIGLFGLIAVMHKRIGLISKDFMVNILKCIAAAAIMAGAVALILPYVKIGVASRLLGIVIPVVFGMLVYFTAAWLLRLPQGMQLVDILLRRKK